MPQTLTFSSNEHSIRIAAQELTEGDQTGRRRPAILLLHGSGGNIDIWSSHLSAILQQAGIHLYAPHYFDRTGTTRADMQTLTDGVHVPQWLSTIDDALRFVAARPCVDSSRVILAGISLGAFLGLALAAQFSASSDENDHARVRAVVDISGGLVPPFAELATSRFPPTLILHGAADTIVPASFAEALTNRLAQLGVSHRTELLGGEGHWFSPVAWPRLLLAVSAFLQPLLE